MKSVVILLGLLVTTSVFAKDVSSTNKVMADKYFLTAQCGKYIESLPIEEQATLADMADILVQDDILGYLRGGDSVTKSIKPALQSSGVSLNGGFIPEEGKYKSQLRILNAFEHELIPDTKMNEAVAKYKIYVTKKQKITASNILMFVLCKAAIPMTGVGIYANYQLKLQSYIDQRPTEAPIGYFKVSVNNGYSTTKVNVGNQFLEPKSWEGSRFFIVDASFKNLDTESRLPIGGSLFINYNGKDYEFDSVEPIMAEGYNIWFRQINPLITMKTKLVYRIPNEVEGEVYWRPGRNLSDTRLWVGSVTAQK